MNPVAAGLDQPTWHGAPVPNPSGEHRVAVLSARLIQAALNTYGEDHAEFARRAGVPAEVIAGAASAECPAWALPDEMFTAIADAIAILWPCAVFETATACDLLLTCVLNGEHVMATDVLTDPSSRDLARALLSMVIASKTSDAHKALLADDLLELLSDRAAALAASGSPDAWVGLEILAAGQGGPS
jgi:hypothetical protein